jgi:hypothetical protein
MQARPLWGIQCLLLDMGIRFTSVLILISISAGTNMICTARHLDEPFSDSTKSIWR